jgi:transmembrane 9 superfamily protein 2/4
MRTKRAKSAIALLAFAPFAQAWYLPGTSPHDYQAGDRIEVLANTVTPLSDADKVHSILSYDYYTPQFHFCRPADGPKAQAESLGSILFGDRLFNSPFELNMMRPESCKTLCKANMSGEDAAFVNDRVKERYAIHWLVDGLPAGKEVLPGQLFRLSCCRSQG